MEHPSPSPERTLEGYTAEPSEYPQVLVYQGHQRIHGTVLDCPIEVGRQRVGEQPPVHREDQADRSRLIVAALDDLDVSRSQLLLTPLEDGRQVEVKNLSGAMAVRLSPNTRLGPGEAQVTEVPLLVQFSSFAVRVDPPEDDDLQLEALPERTMAPGAQSVEARLSRLNLDTMDERLLLRWLETVLLVFQSAATTSNFPLHAAQALVKIIGLDAAAMLHCSAEGRWDVAALHSDDPNITTATWAPSQTLLGRVRTEKRTFRHVPANVPDSADSLQDVVALVSAPILDGDDNVIGALYGDRRGGGSIHEMPEISSFEAKLVELLASGIAGGLARVKEEEAALKARVQFEQFFTPQLAEHLERDPKLLEGRDAETTILFADIRSFSKISERLGPTATMDWIQDTMGALSECVLECSGVLVDYLGDELMAMWGAPLSQPDHAELACRAAHQMQRKIPEINERWSERLGLAMRLGIGLNSGVCRVGNTGTRQKFKYGPLGDSVNIASRVQGATKYLGSECLMTGTTLELLKPRPPSRRLAKVRVVNIEQPIDLYETPCDPIEAWPELQKRYEDALEALERKEVEEAQKLVNRLLEEFPEDRASQALSSRIEASLSSGDPADTAVWHLPGK